jgi:hypothetical protein
MPDQGPYTTITVDEFSRLAATINHLRRQVQKAREHLEKSEVKEALNILRFEDDHLG